MRWILVSSQHHPSQGGIGAAVEQFCRAATEAGWDLQLITRPGGSHVPGVQVHEVQTSDVLPDFHDWIAPLRKVERIRPYRYGLWSLAVAEKILELNIDADAIEFVDCQAEGFVALTSRHVRTHCGRAALIVSAHTPMWLHEANAGLDPARYGRAIYSEWERTALNASDGVIAPSGGLLRRLDCRRPSLILPPPLHPVAVTTPPSTRQIAMIGSVQPQKGVDTWARSLNRVLAERRQAVAVLIGPDTPTGPGGSSMAEHVANLIDPSLRRRFRWRGLLPHDQVMRVIDESALVVVPSVFESFSFVAAEAILRGRPVIVGEDVGLMEHLSGLTTVRPDDFDALAEAQLAMLDNLSSEFQRAVMFRDALIDVCKPQQHLLQREHFVQSLANRDRRCAAEGPDSIEVMEWILRDIERQANAAAAESKPLLATRSET